MNCTTGNEKMIGQICQLLNRLSDDMLSDPLRSLDGSTIGQHIRHIYDFYDCIIRGQQSGGCIDYCLRQRNQIIEKHSAYAVKALRQITDQLKAIDASEAIEVLTDFSTDQQAERVQVGSTIGRELMYAFDHAVHHLAIIQIGIRLHYPQISIPKNIGKAPSTIKYEKSIS